ncbi:unnamed protein product [Malus baccata var. baccata]
MKIVFAQRKHNDSPTSLKSPRYPAVSVHHRTDKVKRFFSVFQTLTMRLVLQKMKVVPREAEKLNVNNAGFLAQKRLARGLRLNHPEAAELS